MEMQESITVRTEVATHRTKDDGQCFTVVVIRTEWLQAENREREGERLN